MQSRLPRYSCFVVGTVMTRQRPRHGPKLEQNPESRISKDQHGPREYENTRIFPLHCDDPADSAARPQTRAESESTGANRLHHDFAKNLQHAPALGQNQSCARQAPNQSPESRIMRGRARGEARKSRIENHEAPGKDFRLKRENAEFRIQNHRCKQVRSARIQSSESRRRLARL